MFELIWLAGWGVYMVWVVYCFAAYVLACLITLVLILCGLHFLAMRWRENRRHRREGLPYVVIGEHDDA